MYIEVSMGGTETYARQRLHKQLLEVASRIYPADATFPSPPAEGNPHLFIRCCP
ncbi:MAG: hypothetical protein RLZZ12_630 [Actinomycetota bacterium]|jgi:hypothetical protein